MLDWQSTSLVLFHEDFFRKKLAISLLKQQFREVAYNHFMGSMFFLTIYINQFVNNFPTLLCTKKEYGF